MNIDYQESNCFVVSDCVFKDMRRRRILASIYYIKGLLQSFRTKPFAMPLAFRSFISFLFMKKMIMITRRFSENVFKVRIKSLCDSHDNFFASIFREQKELRNQDKKFLTYNRFHFPPNAKLGNPVAGELHLRDQNPCLISIGRRGETNI